MGYDLHDMFQHAAKFYYKRYKKQGGSQKELADELGITQSYLSSVINGSRTASLEMHSKIAKVLFGPYDKFLKAGRQIMDGLDPTEQEKPDPYDSVENLIAHLTHYVMEQQLIQKQLRISEERFRDISLTTGDMIFETDSNFKFKYISGKVKEVLGLEKNDMLGKKPADFLTDEEWQKIKQLVDQSIIDKDIFDTIVNVSRDGEDYRRHVIAKPIFTKSSGEFVGLRGTYRDITKRKNLERQLNEQVWLFQSAIDSITEVGVVITDKENKVLRWNTAYQDMFGYPTEIIETCNLLKYFSFLRENNVLADYDDFFKDIQKTQNSKIETIHNFKLSDGRTIRRRSKPIYKDDDFAGRVSFLEDVTKHKKS